MTCWIISNKLPRPSKMCVFVCFGNLIFLTGFKFCNQVVHDFVHDAGKQNIFNFQWMEEKKDNFREKMAQVSKWLKHAEDIPPN